MAQKHTRKASQKEPRKTPQSQPRELPQGPSRKPSRKQPWNKGKSIGQMRPLTPAEVQTIKRLLKTEGSARDLALFSTAIDTMLRSRDLLALTMNDVTDHDGRVLEEFTVRQQKTGKGTLVALMPGTRAALKDWIEKDNKLPWEPLFTGLRGGKHKARDKPITTTQYRTLVKKWVGYARLDPALYSSHSLRRTKAALVFEATRNVEVVRQLLGQSTVSATSAYLNVDSKRALDIARKIEI